MPTYYIYDLWGRLTTEERLVAMENEDETTSIVMYPINQYVWGPDRVLAKIDNLTGDKYYYLYNGHGDVVQITNTSGEVVNSYDYDVWGNFLEKEETIHNPFTYFGQTYDETTGLYYLRTRYYDPTTGRFTQQDPAEDGYNWYIYGTQNPVLYVDYTGEGIILASILICAFIGGTIGGITAAQYSESKLGYVDGEWVLTGAVAGALVGGLVGWGIGEVAAALGTTATVGSTGTLGPAIYKTWQEAEEALRISMNGVKQTFATTFGNRIVDSYNAATKTIAEAKYGYAALSEFIKNEIAKDAYLLKNTAIEVVEWHFYTSAATDIGGPSQPLLDALFAEGFKVIFH